jgi:ribose 1,5-bisphosphokinase PhnN
MGLEMHNFTPRLFIVVGSPASGKDELISAVNTIGILHAEIVPKHTNRSVRPEDGDEMICPQKYSNGQIIDNVEFDIQNCDVQYESYHTKYGIKTSEIWDKLRVGIMQVAVVSDSIALNQLKSKFGNLAVVVYVYSQINREAYRERETAKLNARNGNITESVNEKDYINLRVETFDKAWNIYVDNFMLFDHVLIYADKQEDLFDQIFRLFKAYEKGLIQ